MRCVWHVVMMCCCRDCRTTSTTENCVRSGVLYAEKEETEEQEHHVRGQARGVGDCSKVHWLHNPN